MVRILIIDDDVELCGMLRTYFAQHGFELMAYHNAFVGLEQVRKQVFDLIVLDVMLPDTDGFSALRSLRTWSEIGVLVLTARGDDNDRVMGFEAGADDYLAKPFHPPELIARIRAILRRRQVASVTDKHLPRLLAIENLVMDLDSRTAEVDGHELDLTATEFDLLTVFVQTPGQVLSREALLKRVFGRSFHPDDRTLDMCVSRLRRKLNTDIPSRWQIKTIRSEGYLFSAGA